jgi:hypothetical protein
MCGKEERDDITVRGVVDNQKFPSNNAWNPSQADGGWAMT